MLSKFSKLCQAFYQRRPVSTHSSFRPIAWNHEVFDKMLQSSPVVVFMQGTPSSPQCEASKSLVHLLEVYQLTDYLAVDVRTAPELVQEIHTYSQVPVIPQIYVNQRLIGGVETLVDLEDKGELARFFSQEGLLK